MDAIIEAVKFLWIPLGVIFGLMAKMQDSAIRNQHNRMKRLEDIADRQASVLSDLQIDLGRNYVTREEIRMELSSISIKLDKIFDKLENKVDK